MRQPGRSPFGARALALCLCVAGSVACESRHTGDRGKLVFVYESWDEFEDFNKPIATGATLEMRVEGVGDAWSDELDVVAMRSADSSTIEMGDSFQNVFEVKGVKAGSARFGVAVKRRADAESAGTTRDLVRMRVADIHEVDMSHACTGDDAAVYLAGSRGVDVSYWRYAENGELLTGVGQFPVEMTGGEVRAITNGSSFKVDFDEGARTYRLSSPLADRALTFETVAPSDIDGLAVSEFDADAITLVGYEAFLSFDQTHRQRRLCGESLPLAAKSLTPSICSVEVWGSFVDVKGLAYGVCELEARVVGGDPSAKAVATVRVGTLPGDGQPDPPSRDGIASADLLAKAANGRWLVALLALFTPLALAPLWLYVGRRRREDRNV